jgi:hypothetical protein
MPVIIIADDEDNYDQITLDLADATEHVIYAKSHIQELKEQIGILVDQLTTAEIHCMKMQNQLTWQTHGDFPYLTCHTRIATSNSMYSSNAGYPEPFSGTYHSPCYSSLM